jgi:hypothetical protein
VVLAAWGVSAVLPGNSYPATDYWTYSYQLWWGILIISSQVESNGFWWDSFPLFNFQYLYQRLPLCVNLIQLSHVEYVFSGVKKGCSFKPSISDVLDLKNLLILSLVFSLSLMNCVLWSEMHRLDKFILWFKVRYVKRWNYLVIW